ncbi:MAG: sterol desaturase family protein [Actinobacteria bacterium]|nr:sterol desaturase family protein [Actinomycetota bacterium]
MARFVVALLAGAVLWTFAEYLLHRFVMHELRGRGFISRAHLEHHVTSSWTFDANHPLSWLGIVVVGFGGLMPLAWLLVGSDRGVGLGVAIGWAAMYAFYETVHALAHLRAPRSQYGVWLRRHHFHHHFGHPMANQGVSVGVWDRVFRTHDTPGVIRVPRRLALPWMLDGSGHLLERYAADYELVGTGSNDERMANLDRARAFASEAPAD